MTKKKSQSENEKRSPEILAPGLDLDALARECQTILTGASEENLKLAAIEELRKIAESRAKVVPTASREENLRQYSDKELMAEVDRRHLQVEIHVSFDRP